MNSIIDNIEQNAAKYNSDKENLKERLIEISNKCNDLRKLNNDSWKKYIDLSVESGDEVSNNFEIMYNESERVYNKDYSTGEYCHEQSFKWGFQEGFDFAMKLIKGE